MKIALVTDADVFAGTERHILDLACALREHACDVTVLCPDRGLLADRAREASIPVLPVEKGSALNFPVVAQLAACFRQGRFDLLHAHNGRTALHAVLASAIAPQGRIIATQHFIDPARAGRKGGKALLMNQAHRWAGRRIRHVIAISDAVRSAALARGEIGGCKISVIPNGIADPLRFPLRSVSSVRAELGIRPETPVFATVARLEVEKGLSTLIEAMAFAIQDQPELKCLILGAGSMRAKLEEEIARGGLQSAVRLLGFQEDVFSVVNASDFFVLPSPNEPFGLAVVEAMGLSKAVIAAQAGGPAEILRDGETGILCAPSDANAFGRAIVQLAADPALRTRMGLRGRGRFLERFTAARMAADTLQIYETALGHTKTSSSPVSDKIRQTIRSIDHGANAA